jgi:hypothetical protein
VVLSRLEVKPRPPTPPLPGPNNWQPKTPTNAIEIKSQTTLIIKRIREHKSSSPDSTIETVLQVKRGSTKRDHSHTLLKARIAKLEQANQAASERKKRKTKRIQKGGDFSKEQAEDLIAQCDVGAQIEGETRESRARTGASKRGKRHCKRCGETGHNSRTFTKIVVDVSD